MPFPNSMLSIFMIAITAFMIYGYAIHNQKQFESTEEFPCHKRQRGLPYILGQTSLRFVYIKHA